MNTYPLRSDAVRTPDTCFGNVPDYPWVANYLNDLPALAGLRMHYLDEGQRDARLTYLCLHGNPAWSYLYRKMIPLFVAAGYRVVAPDMIGFGKSDKPINDSAHSFSWHRQVLLEFVNRLNLSQVVLVVQDWGGILGLTLPMDTPDRYEGLLVMNTTLATGDQALSEGFMAWRDMCAKNPEFDIARLMARSDRSLLPEECAAYMAPFPDSTYRAATRAFPTMVPDNPDADGAQTSGKAREFWRDQWSGKVLMAVGMRDPVLGWDVMRTLKSNIRNCPEPLQIAEGGHFVQEQGASIAQAAVSLF